MRKLIILLAFFLTISQNINAQNSIRTINFNGSPCDVFSVSVNYENELITGEFLVILGDNNTKLTKPFIIAEGIDFEEDQEFPTHIGLYNNNNSIDREENSLIDQLLSLGYDIIILDYDKSTIEIQKNARLFTELLTTVNNLKENPNENNTVVMGYSMGGLVTRYGLTWMEKNNINHHTRLYVSHDAPHKGANVPLGIQHLIRSVSTKSGLASFPLSLALLSVYKSFPAFEQLLVYSEKASLNGVAMPSLLKHDFFEEMYNLNPNNNGFPSIPYKIALSNGSSQLKVGSEGEEVFSIEYRKENTPTTERFPWVVSKGWSGCPAWYKFKGCTKTFYWVDDTVLGSVNKGFVSDEFLSSYSINMYKGIIKGGEDVFFSDENLSYDNVAGSTSFLLSNLETKLNVLDDFEYTIGEDFCFIPTISSLDYTIDPSEFYTGVSRELFHERSSFDDFILNEFNGEHNNIYNSQVDFIMSNINNNNVIVDRYVNDNLILSNIDFENSSVFVAKENVTIIGDVIINGAKRVTSGNSITLKNGFSVAQGGEFSAKIKSTGFIKQKSEYNPHVIADNVTELENSSVSYKTFDEDEEVVLEIDVDEAFKNSLYVDIIGGDLHINFNVDIEYENLNLSVVDINNNTISKTYTNNESLIINKGSLNYSQPVYMSFDINGVYSCSFAILIIN
ncbi:esterase/lipase family protein [Wenyingzhuangia marina]|uniref:Lecithin:cholesterol acyltransferase n=1 Tax=Wenyingzhuangia marina TaxID=1195760 RepID=A0A1M5RXZ0_9FLAO|nr:3-coathanger stack domain-containing protein [Wenyingzhuangia marina]GGF78141.1 hypothetical protein GCM10011397_21380 [Wenyingzhuangia marina]SHH31105.1 Lecithin:cholesterol acyltransferase [Wenyingzhuangia marina]